MSTELVTTKTYVLLDVMDATAPVFQQLGNGQRAQIKKIPFYHPYRRVSFFEKTGKSRVIRYKAYSQFIDQDKQVKEESILANEPFTPQEKKDLEFRFGICVTNKLRAQQYLETYPAFEGFDGYCDDIKEPQYKLLDKESESKIKNSDIRLRVKAANKVLDCSLEQLQAMLIRLNGSFFETPNDPEECQNMLMEFIDDSEEAGLLAVLQEEDEINIDDKTTILIGKLINAGLLSFDQVEGKISKKGKDNKWITIRDMSSEYSMEERKRLFSDFLNTEDGKPLKNDLENDLSGISESALPSENIKKSGRPKKGS